MSTAPLQHGRIPLAHRPARSGAATATARRHLAWLAAGVVVSFLIPFVLADTLELQRDLYYGMYGAAAIGLFVAWIRDTGQSPRQLCSRRWHWALALGALGAAASVAIVLNNEDATTHPGGLEFIGSLI